MSDWLPSATIADLQKRALILASIRVFFSTRAVIEVDTPMLSASGLTCPEIDSFTVQPSGNLNLIRPANTGYLHTSPEFPMKRLIAAGMGDCYQLCHVFRAWESGVQHNPEFMLLEWYRVGWSSQQLMDEVAELILSLFREFAPERIPTSVEHKTYQSVFQDFLDVDPLTATSEQLREVAVSRGGTFMLSDLQKDTYQCDDWLSYIMAVFIEPRLPDDVLTFVTEYPISQAALARKNPDDERTALRFECYFGCRELANGFDELTDSQEQLARFEAENQHRLATRREAVPIDHHLIEALDNMPDTSGVALGVDRLIMLLLGKTTIEDVMAFPASRA